MKAILVLISIGIITFSCDSSQYYVTEADNPVYNPNRAFQSMEDLTNPGFSHLKEKYQIDTIFHGETDEFKRILLLRNWIKSVVMINDTGDPYPGGGFTEGILDAALNGQGFHCGHFMTVQNGVMNAYGYVTRALGAGPGVQGIEGPDGHHGINEIWSNQYSKWVLSDAKYNHHCEKNGIPLSSLEVRDEYLKNEAADVQLALGTDREYIDYNPVIERRKDEFARTYRWITWHENDDYFCAWPEHDGRIVMFEDQFYSDHIWVRDGKPCWIYGNMDVIKLIQNREEIEWTPNVIASEVVIDGTTANITLTSDTPNLKEYQVKDSDSGSWKKADEKLNLELTSKKHELVFRTLNLAGVSGPEHTIIIERK
jgi:hypothetical protein